jgi:hypothetical protein
VIRLTGRVCIGVEVKAQQWKSSRLATCSASKRSIKLIHPCSLLMQGEYPLNLITAMMECCGSLGRQGSHFTRLLSPTGVPVTG